MIVQLDPMIPCRVLAHPNKPARTWPEGKAHAIGWLDYSQEHDLIWIVAIDTESGEAEPWCVPNRYVRLASNVSLGRS